MTEKAFEIRQGVNISEEDNYTDQVSSQSEEGGLKTTELYASLKHKTKILSNTYKTCERIFS